MQLKRTVVGIQTQFFPTGSNFTIPAAGVASSSSKPGATDPAWLLFGNVKWGMEGDHKSETYMEPTPGAYAATDKILLSKGLKGKGKLEKLSNFAYQLLWAAQPLPASATYGGAAPVAGGVYNPLSGNPIVQGWLHWQEYDGNNTLLNTVDIYVALQASGSANRDDKPAETNVEFEVLFSNLNVGTLS